MRLNAQGLIKKESLWASVLLMNTDAKNQNSVLEAKCGNYIKRTTRLCLFPVCMLSSFESQPV